MQANEPTSPERMMEMATAVAQGMKPVEAVRHFQVGKSALYRALRHYESVTGERLVGPSTVQKGAMKRAAAAARKAAQSKANGGALAHSKLPHANRIELDYIGDSHVDWQQRALTAEAQARELRAELEHATDEAHTLQRIIITLGRAL